MKAFKWFLAGFIEGEGSLTVSVKEHKSSRFGYYVDPEFYNNYPDSLQTPLPQELIVSKFLLGLLELIPKANAIPMYLYDDPNLTDDPIFMVIGRNDNTGQYDFVFSGTPIHLLQGNNNVDELFRIIFRDIFQP